MDEAIQEAKESIRIKELAEKNHATTQKGKNPKYTSSQLLAKFFKRPSENARKMGKADLFYRDIIRRAERKMYEVKNAKAAKNQGTEAKAESLAEMLFHRPGSKLTSQEIARAWQEAGEGVTTEIPDCNFATVNLYRTIDGTCNNLMEPLFGSTGRALRRLVPPHYEDGISSLRGNLQAQDEFSIGPFVPPSPSARLISDTVIRDLPREEVSLSHLLMQWGQFLDHDFGLTPELEPEEECEGCHFSDICQPIQVPGQDEAFGRDTPNNGNCLPFRRSISVPQEEYLPQQQINDVTSYIDGSMVYGSTDSVARALRKFEGGLLLEGERNNNGMASLPIDGNDLVQCPDNNNCFLCGDVRCNEQISLTVMHTLWFREHNRCARELASINPFWNDERLYQTCRKIVGALIQKITYQDFLPKILGEETISEYIGLYSGYDDTIDATIPNSFSAAAFRFGHSLIQAEFNRLDSDYAPISTGALNLVDAFMSPDQFETSNGTDPIARGWVSDNARKSDEFLNSVLTTRLFEPDEMTPGMDLAALNIQRGRDHGLPPYSVYREFCLEKFGKNPNIRNRVTFVNFLRLHGSVENADLWLAGLAERRLSRDGLLGATFTCIFALTFNGLREGDRFFWLNPGVFTRNQRNSINKHSIARVICDNSDGITSIQPDAFLANQDRVDCSSLGGIDFTLFVEKVCFYHAQVKARSFPVWINTLSRSTGKEYFDRTEIAASRSDVDACIPIQCPRGPIPTTIIAFSSRNNFFFNLASFEVNQNLPEGDPIFQRFGSYLGQWSSTHFVTGTGVVQEPGCEQSPDVAITFDFGQNKLESQVQPELQQFPLAEVQVKQFVPDEIIKWLESTNRNAEPFESINTVNSDLTDGAEEVNEQEERKKTASLFSELEEALKKLN